MLRYQLLAFTCIAVNAAIFPPAIQEYSRAGEPEVWQPGSDDALWKEYGLLEAERVDYKGASRPFTMTAWKMKDATGALAAFQWQRPVDAAPIPTMAYGARFATGVIAASGNYLLRIDGFRPRASELVVLFRDLDGYFSGPLPVLPTYLPDSRTAAADRYIVGEHSLAAFLPGWSRSLAAFDDGVEIQVTKVQNARLAIVRYPTQHIAKAKLKEVSADPSVRAHRSGPLLAVLSPLEGSEPPSEALLPVLETIEFKANVVANEANPLHFVKDAANMVLSIFALAGILLAICLGAGLIVGGIRIMQARNGNAGEALQTLHLSDR